MHIPIRQTFGIAFFAVYIRDLFQRKALLSFGARSSLRNKGEREPKVVFKIAIAVCYMYITHGSLGRVIVWLIGLSYGNNDLGDWYCFFLIIFFFDDLFLTLKKYIYFGFHLRQDFFFIQNFSL